MELPQKRPRVSFEQREKMLEFMIAHPDFAKNRVTGQDAARKKIRLQEEFSNILNSTATGATKSADKWIKDWRSDVKAKAAKIRHAQHQTGGGPGPTPLSSLEENLMSFIGIEAAEGIAVADTLEPETPNTEPITETETIVEESRAPKKQDKLEEAITIQAAAMDQLSQSMNTLAAAINNLAVALSSMTISTQEV